MAKEEASDVLNHTIISFFPRISSKNIHTENRKCIELSFVSSIFIIWFIHACHKHDRQFNDARVGHKTRSLSIQLNTGCSFSLYLSISISISFLRIHIISKILASEFWSSSVAGKLCKSSLSNHHECRRVRFFLFLHFSVFHFSGVHNQTQRIVCAKFKGSYFSVSLVVCCQIMNTLTERGKKNKMVFHIIREIVF